MSPIMLRLDVEAMRYQVVHAFADRSQEIQDEIGAGVEAALKGFDFAAVVREECQKVIREAVKSAVAYAASSIMQQEPIQGIIKGIIKKGVERQVLEAIEESLKDV